MTRNVRRVDSRLDVYNIKKKKKCTRTGSFQCIIFRRARWGWGGEINFRGSLHRGAVAPSFCVRSLG
ncbi:hypothetical protein PUN28_008940 [Cardiocondyla obscurior]|uniref:Ribosomal protein S14 n=1 Tax=Cardiocondyla obscurior TaxID=286306 RepID=A0AAW2FR72_9HYME